MSLYSLLFGSPQEIIITEKLLALGNKLTNSYINCMAPSENAVLSFN